MSKILAVALNTFREAVRNKILYFLLLFAILIIGFSTFLSDLSIAGPEKLIKDIGLASIDFIGFLIAVLVGINLIYNEIEKKTIYTIVSKPIDRYQFIWGKYFGLLITVYVNFVIMTIVFFTVLYYRDMTSTEAIQKAFFSGGEGAAVGNSAYILFHLKALGFAIVKGIATFFGYGGDPLTHHLMRVVGMSMLSLAVITAYTILYSTFATPTLSAIYTYLTFVIGTMCNDIVRYAETIARQVGGEANLHGMEAVKYYVAWCGGLIVPNLELFNKRQEAVYGKWDVMENPIAHVSIDPVVIGYGIVYTIGIMFLACLIFNRRNFK